MTHPKSIFSVKNFLVAAFAIFFLSSCGEQEQQFVAVSENAQAAEASATGSNVQSLTISGENTEFSESVSCSTCTYIVPANAKVVDGKELGFKPGAVICIDAGLKYGNVDFTNIVGTSEAPITIGTCK